MTTFAVFAEQLVDERASWIRGASKERNRFELHVRTAAFAGLAMNDVKSLHIAEWHRAMQQKPARDRREARTLSDPSIDRCTALISVVFSEALTRGLVERNPCLGLRLHRRVDERSVREKWAYLTVEEQSAVLACDAIPEWDKRGMQFAWGTGLRQGEQCNLHLSDVHVDGADPHVFVRFGSPGKAPKSGKTRRVPLFGHGLEAARALVEIAKTVPNPNGLLFPSKTGSVRNVGKALGRGVKIDGRWVDPFHLHLRAAGITKHLRWHDLRHTCASSLVMGVWGNRKWELIEVRDMLGHSSVQITERYAHLSGSALRDAARETAAALPTARSSSEAANDAPPNRPGCIVGLFRGLIEIVRRPVHREERAA